MTRFRKFAQSKRFRRGEDGSMAVEFAIISPVLFLLIMGLVEIGLILSARNILESATYLASRTGRIGYVADNKTQEETIRDALEERASLLFDTERLSIDSLNMTNSSYGNYDNIGQPEPWVDANGNGEWDFGENFTDVNGNGGWDADQGAGGAGNTGEVVVYTVTYPWRLFTPLVASVIGEDGIVNITARAVVKNEPF